MTTDILTQIVAHKKREVAASEERRPVSTLQKAVEQRSDFRPFFEALHIPGPGGVNIIAEIKRASPSKGVIRVDLDPAAFARSYAAGGAAALSVLTDAAFFRGSAEDLTLARGAVSLPVLRKDFVVSEYQIWESAALGADAVLLIVRILTSDQLQAYRHLAETIGLDVLVEVHTPDDLELAMAAGARLIGINNRNLASFETDLRTAVRLVARMGTDHVPVAASGIQERRDIELNLTAGIFNFLIGEHLVRKDDPAAFLRILRGAE